MRLLSLLTVLAITCVYAQNPTPPASFPPAWYTWVVTSVVKVGVDKPLYDVGQLIGYDSINKWSCRLNQQDLLTPKPNRPVDYCDYSGGKHYSMLSTLPNATCSSSVATQGTLTSIPFPAEYLAAAKFIGVDKVNQDTCNHFVATPIMVNGTNIQMDVWTDTKTNYPCQISITQLSTQIITTWAFDGFGTVFPPDSVNQCLATKIMCAEPNWVCWPKSGITDQQLISALGWVCDPSHLDCTPINPGGAHYLPNTPTDHAKWAFTAYYDLHRTVQGPAACDFGGIAQIVPPATARLSPKKVLDVGQDDFFAVFSNNLTCE